MPDPVQSMAAGDLSAIDVEALGAWVEGQRWYASKSRDVSVRPMGVEQSNSSLVFGDELVMKVFRKLEAGLNPELELLRFLSARDFPNIAPLYGWYDYDGHALAATLGVAQQFIPDGVGGWELALDEIESDPDGFLSKLGSLGEVTAQMHTVLA